MPNNRGKHDIRRYSRSNGRQTTTRWMVRGQSTPSIGHGRVYRRRQNWISYQLLIEVNMTRTEEGGIFHAVGILIRLRSAINYTDDYPALRFWLLSRAMDQITGCKSV